MAINTNTTSSNITSPDSRQINGAAPPLAFYKDRSQWMPKYGDYITKSNWFSTWVGIVVGFDGVDKLEVIWAGLPFLLFTMSPSEHAKETKHESLSDIRNSSNGKYAIQQSDSKTKESVWYV